MRPLREQSGDLNIRALQNNQAIRRGNINQIIGTLNLPQEEKK